MITRILATASLAALALVGASCERHSWEDTKVLHHHGDHGHDAHGDDHGDHKGHEHKEGDKH